MYAKPSFWIRVLMGLAGTVLIASTAVVAVNYGLGTFKGGYRLEAVFPQSAQGLDKTSDVKMRGVTVGTVKAITLQPDGRAKVTLKMRAGALVPDTAAATIEPLSVFGPEYISLNPGEHELSGPFLGHGGQISKTSLSVAFTTVLNRADAVLSAVNTSDLVTIFQTFADSVAGLGPEMGRIFDNVAALVDIGVRHLPQAQQFLSDLVQLSDSLARQVPSVGSTVTNLNQVLPVVTSRSDQLGTVLDGAASIAGQLAGYIEGHRDSFGTFVNSAATVLRVAYLQVPHFPDVFNLLDQFFGRVGDAVRLPGPGGVLIGALHGSVAQNLCGAVSLPVACQVVR